MRRVWQVIRRGGIGALDLLLPPQCLTCDAPVGRPGEFCVACFAATRFVTAPHCDRCGQGLSCTGEAALRSGSSVVLCGICRDAPPPWSRGRAALVYDDQARRLILALKHGDRTDLARPLARMMQRVGAALLRDCEVIVPVPLHRRRLLARRYNQAALLTQALGRLSGRRAAPDALRRTRPTASLGHLGRAARYAAVGGAFAVPQARRKTVAGRRVLLVDDVMTSGATLAACAEALWAAGAADVAVLVAARVRNPADDTVPLHDAGITPKPLIAIAQ